MQGLRGDLGKFHESDHGKIRGLPLVWSLWASGRGACDSEKVPDDQYNGRLLQPDPAAAPSSARAWLKRGRWRFAAYGRHPPQSLSPTSTVTRGPGLSASRGLLLWQKATVPCVFEHASTPLGCKPIPATCLAFGTFANLKAPVLGFPHAALRVRESLCCYHGEVATGTLRKIIRKSGLTVEEFNDVL